MQAHHPASELVLHIVTLYSVWDRAELLLIEEAPDHQKCQPCHVWGGDYQSLLLPKTGLVVFSVLLDPKPLSGDLIP